MLPLLGNDLDSSTLHLYLKEYTFVEYFNSFLLLPAFSCRVFFDRDSGYFEPVHGEGTKLYWEESTGDVTPSSSQATLYLTDENMGPALDRLQSWSWVVEYRLPLFLKSDIFSEYKLCKLLSQRDTTTSSRLSPMKSNSNTRLSISEDRHSETCLPSILQSSTSSILLSTVSATSLQQPAHKPSGGLSASTSDNVLLTKRQSLLGGQRSQSMDLTPALLDPQTTRLSKDEAKTISSKSGMKNFWKFLRGKAGEKNWLFWLDAERVSYHTNPIDQQRLLREVREKYLHSSGALVLPAETRNKARVNKTSKLTLSQLIELQHILVQRLRDYWCPRFLTHYYTEAAAPSYQPGPLSCAPLVVQELTNYPRIATPHTPTGTPTFRRLTGGRTRSFSSPTSYRRTGESRIYERTKTDHGLFAEESDVSVKGVSRRVWGDKEDTVKTIRGETVISGKKSYFDKVAKYTLHHVPDTNSRCASGMDGQLNNSGMCENQCTILSVSGTPLHTIPPTPAYPHTLTGEYQPSSMELYEPLIICLNTEHRKAGGYFQQHLASNQEKVFLHCLMFWRDVQEYKSLFIGASFSPCTVEMKAKTLYGRFISQGCEECIECSQSIVETVFANLWPAYEDLFDSAEEHALGLLLLQWVDMVTSEDQLFQKLDSATSARRVSSRGSKRALEELEEESLSGEMGSTFFLHPSSSLRMSRSHSGGISGRSSRASSGRASVSLTMDKATSLNDIMKNRVELDQFKIFLNEQCAAQDLMCWMEIEAFRGIPVSDKTMRNVKAKQLKGRYFNKSYLFGPNSPASKEGQRQIMSAGGGVYTGRLPARPHTPVLIEAQKYVRQRLEKKWLIEFIQSPAYRSRNNKATRSASGRRLSTNGKDMASAYETSFTNSHEALTFRKILHDKDQVNFLLRYLDIRSISTSSGRGLLVRQNITFWLEVQRFKEMFHAHTKESMLTNKARAIMDCFFLSSVPPKLQVNVPLIVAEELTNKPHGPYLFREAQAAVFKYLYGCWLDYKGFANGSDGIHLALDRLEAELLRNKRAERESKTNDLLDEERKKLSVPRFESMADKIERMRLEKERSEIGDVYVSFRLSNPSHKYTYYTPLPAQFVERQQAMDSPQVQMKEKHVCANCAHPESKNLQERSVTNPLPMAPVVKSVKQTETRKPTQCTVCIDEPDEITMESPEHMQSCQKQVVCKTTAFKRFTVQARGKSGGGKKRVSSGHTTISMRRSGEKGGSPFTYGAGLNEQSTIAVLNMETVSP